MVQDFYMLFQLLEMLNKQQEQNQENHQMQSKEKINEKFVVF
jgi:hypothetical protein